MHAGILKDSFKIFTLAKLMLELCDTAKGQKVGQDLTLQKARLTAIDKT